jgi:hypothetical protein
MSPASRLLAALLALSLAGHAVWWWRDRSADRALEEAAAAEKARAGAAFARPSSAADAPAARPAGASGDDALAAALTGGDLVALNQRLLALGADTKLRRDLLHLVLHHRYESRFRAVFPEGTDEAAGAWWRNPVWRGSDSPRAQAERQRAARELQAELEEEMARITGEDPRNIEVAQNPYLARQFAGLPPAKAEALHRLQRDYQEMEQDILAEAAGFQLPEDLEKIRLLKAERERDIAALLSPEERAEWELRASPSADRARELATEFQASEEEYRAIFALQKAMDDAFPSENPFDPPLRIDWQRRQELQQELEAAVRKLVGEGRYLAARRERDPDYVVARAAVARLGLPEDQARRVVELRAPAEAASRRIAADATLDEARRNAALSKLAEEVRAGLARELGPAGAAAYVDRGGMAWLRLLENGSAFALEPDGVTYSVVESRVVPVEPVEPIPPRVPLIRID